MITKLKPEIKQLWTAALRSGEFKQTTGMLRNDGGMCCLGVLCELHRRATGDELAGDWESFKERPAADIDALCSVYGECVSTPPPAVYAWALDPIGDDGKAKLLNAHRGLLFRDVREAGMAPLTDGLWAAALISEANDRGSTFSEIADAIDKYL